MALLVVSDAAAGMLQPVVVQAERQTAPKETGLEKSALRIEAAFVLRSRHEAFGGLSGIWISDDAERLISVGDTGWVWQARLHHNEHGQLVDIDTWSGAKISARSGAFKVALPYDAEALAGDSNRGLMVAYEGRHAINRLTLPDLKALPGRLHIPQGLGGPSNSGIEALADLGNGQFLAMAEGVGAPGGIGLSAWLIDHSQADLMIYQSTPGFAPTGADRLGSDVYVIERRFSLLGGFRSQISVLSAKQLSAGRSLKPMMLARFRYGDLGENFEAIAAKKAPDGRTLLYLLADDNFSIFQRTVLLQLSLSEAAGDRPSAAEVETEASTVTN